MLKKYLIISLFFIPILIVNSQIDFGSNNIIFQTEKNTSISIYPCDIDGDGDFDVLSASFLHNRIAWYENINGMGTFGDQQIITDSAKRAASVYACDIDGDGDFDVLSASEGDDKISWYENTDGLGTFGDQQIITDFTKGACSVYACDIDGDSDFDVLSASMADSTIAWYENTDGKGVFGDQQVITTYNDGAIFVYACDIDGDGDMDVLSASHYDGKIAWYENLNALGSFGNQQIITNSADWATSVYTCDIDGDGDMDVLSSSNENRKIYWHENTDGKGTFENQKTINTNYAIEGRISFYACDIDRDSDFDVLYASSTGSIAWFENSDGKGAFKERQIIAIDGLTALSVYACDIDGDNDIDVLWSSDSKIVWNENLGKQIDDKNTSLQQNEICIYPILNQDLVCFKYPNNYIENITIFDYTGKQIINKVYKRHIESMDLSYLVSGVYLLKIKTDTEIFSIKFIKK